MSHPSDLAIAPGLIPDAWCPSKIAPNSATFPIHDWGTGGRDHVKEKT